MQDFALLSIKIICSEIDDEMRRLIALLSDNGVRFSVACGLMREDIFLSEENPHLLVRPR